MTKTLFNLILKYKELKKEVILLGDFNTDFGKNNIYGEFLKDHTQFKCLLVISNMIRM